MEYLISFNYGNIVVTESPCSDFLSVMVNENNYENFRWGGVIEMRDQHHLEHGIFSFFRTNPAHRKSDSLHWEYTNNEATILSYVKDMTVYIIIGEDGMPLLVPRDYSNFEDVAIKVDCNVIKLEVLRKTCV